MMMVGRQLHWAETKEPIPDHNLCSRWKTSPSSMSAVFTGLKDVSFTLQSGEILGIAGVDGNGQKELAEMHHRA